MFGRESCVIKFLNLSVKYTCFVDTESESSDDDMEELIGQEKEQLQKEAESRRFPQTAASKTIEPTRFSSDSSDIEEESDAEFFQPHLVRIKRGRPRRKDASMAPPVVAQKRGRSSRSSEKHDSWFVPEDVSVAIKRARLRLMKREGFLPGDSDQPLSFRVTQKRKKRG